jgi:hypothetical protein
LATYVAGPPGVAVVVEVVVGAAEFRRLRDAGASVVPDGSTPHPVSNAAPAVANTALRDHGVPARFCVIERPPYSQRHGEGRSHCEEAVCDHSPEDPRVPERITSWLRPHAQAVGTVSDRNTSNLLAGRRVDGVNV